MVIFLGGDFWEGGRGERGGGLFLVFLGWDGVGGFESWVGFWVGMGVGVGVVERENKGFFFRRRGERTREKGIVNGFFWGGRGMKRFYILRWVDVCRCEERCSWVQLEGGNEWISG